MSPGFINRFLLINISQAFNVFLLTSFYSLNILGGMSINLRPFGLGWSIEPKRFMAIPIDYKNKIKVGYLDKNTVIIGNEFYKLVAKLGGGTYGEVYSCIRRSDNLECCVKMVKDTFAYDLIRELLIQIVIVEKTKTKNYPDLGFQGPFAPIVYDFGYDDDTNTGFIVTQTMNNTLSHLLDDKKTEPDQLTKAMSIALIQLSTILNELYSTLKFNHRDFKTDNCMYVFDDNNRIQMRLIDFGFSYINYNNVVISTSSFDFDFDSLPNRDMTQLIYELYSYHKYIPDYLKTVLEDLLTFPHDGGVCKMYAGCDEMKNWKNTYTFLNSDTVNNPNGNSDIVKKVFAKIYQGLDYKSELAYAPGLKGLFVAKPAIPIVVPAGKIYNPDTGRYVNIDGVIGKRLLKELNAAKPEEKNTVALGLGLKPCPPAKPDRNPKTKRCLKPCAPGKKRNATYKCVSSKHL